MLGSLWKRRTTAQAQRVVVSRAKVPVKVSPPPRRPTLSRPLQNKAGTFRRRKADIRSFPLTFVSEELEQETAPPEKGHMRFNLNTVARPFFDAPGEVVAMILGGGPGNDLYPLTKVRAEPAVPFAGMFRLVDVPISNCVNSGITNVYVLCQYNATSLNRHLGNAYSFVADGAKPHEGFVEALNATQTPYSSAWYQGTADAIRRYAHYLQDTRHNDCEDVLIMCGDQLYRMDYEALVNYHRLNNSDVTIASTPCDEEHASNLGVLNVDKELNVLGFFEKPGKLLLSTMSMDTTSYGLNATDAAEKPFVGSMGIYVFKKQVLLNLLLRDFPEATDFSREILPRSVNQLKITAYPFTAYWEDVGTIKSFYEANMQLTKEDSRLRLFSKETPMYTEGRILPPSKAYDTKVQRLLLADGCYIVDSNIKGSILGPCSYVVGATVEDSVIFGADAFSTDELRSQERAKGKVPLGIGRGSVIKKSIIDKNARIGRNVKLINARRVREAYKEEEGYIIRDGIITILKDAVIPDDTVI